MPDFGPGQRISAVSESVEQARTVQKIPHHHLSIERMAEAMHLLMPGPPGRPGWIHPSGRHAATESPHRGRQVNRDPGASLDRDRQGQRVGLLPVSRYLEPGGFHPLSRIRHRLLKIGNRLVKHPVGRGEVAEGQLRDATAVAESEPMRVRADHKDFPINSSGGGAQGLMIVVLRPYQGWPYHQKKKKGSNAKTHNIETHNREFRSFQA